MAHLNLARTGPQRHECPVSRTPVRRVKVTDGYPLIDLLLSINGQDVRHVNANAGHRVAVINQVGEEALVAAHRLGNLTAVHPSHVPDKDVPLGALRVRRGSDLDVVAEHGDGEVDHILGRRGAALRLAVARSALAVR
ncbi:hypothetical protein IEQ34_007142 [Dendrobium chrysotoxum]|uniref:PDZ domain-containing protein n=1 Tax=Dendrobium chrysotoxum TaxID=161865 RepID=A0AAV7H966_DENCH|nr:hypothetical protein IEQ34_007025 [Dendrobium chrysotoxum]KAH0464356.1 hypothetical protein IEQ34_007142 [Dendrobium chrysotoxum]